MITAVELAAFADDHDWIVVERDQDEGYIRYLTPAGQRVLVKFNPDGSIATIYP